MKFLGIIPARYASTRFPAKPLAMLGGKTVIQRVYEQVAGVLDDAYVATDDEHIEAINITMQLLSWDVFWGSILAIPTALMVMKKAKPENDGPVQS